MLKLYRNLLIKSITALVGLCNISEGDFAANSAYLCKHKVAKTAKLWFQYHTFLFLGCSDRSRPVSEVIRRLWLSELNGNYLVKTMAYWVADVFTFLFTRLLCYFRPVLRVGRCRMLQGLFTVSSGRGVNPAFPVVNKSYS